jgi:cell division protein FtsW
MGLSVIRSAHILIGTVLALLGLGVVMVHSAATQIAGSEPAGPLAQMQAILLSRHTLYALLAVAIMLIASRVDVRGMFRSHPVWNPLWIGLILSFALVGVLLIPGVGKSVNGATRWIQIDAGPIDLTFQPSELVKWTTIVAVAWWCDARRRRMHRFFTGLLPAVGLIGVACALIVVEDFGTAALIGAVCAALLLAGGARLWQLLLFVPPAAGACALAIVQSPYRMQRLATFLNPWQDPKGAGYHPIQSMIAFAEGGLTGSGLGGSIQKFYLPEDTTDFLFPIIAEELGLAGAATIVVLFLVILWVGFGVIKDCRDTFSRLLGLGVLLMLGTQAAMNIAVTTVVVPTKGIALPLVSAGGTGWVVTAAALGLIAALDNANQLEAQAAAPASSDGEASTLHLASEATRNEDHTAPADQTAAADQHAADHTPSNRDDPDDDQPRLRLVS